MESGHMVEMKYGHFEMASGHIVEMESSLR